MEPRRATHIEDRQGFLRLGFYARHGMEMRPARADANAWKTAPARTMIPHEIGNIPGRSTMKGKTP